MYKAIFIDIDDTLLDFNVASKSAFKTSIYDFNLEWNDAIYQTYKNIDDRLWVHQKNGQISVQDVINLRFKELFIQLNIDLDYKYFRDSFQENLSKEHVLIEGALEVIQYLSSKYHLFVASNSLLLMQKSRLKRANLLAYFSDLYISSEIGYEKPDRRFFEICLDRSHISREDVLFVGDSLEADMQGASSCGIDTCWYNPNKLSHDQSIKINYMIQKLTDLKQIL